MLSVVLILPTFTTVKESEPNRGRQNHAAWRECDELGMPHIFSLLVFPPHSGNRIVTGLRKNDELKPIELS